MNIVMLCVLQKEDPKKALIFSGHRTSQTVKDILVDLQKLKAVRFQHFCFHVMCCR